MDWSKGIALNRKKGVRRVISIFPTFQVFVLECIERTQLSGKKNERIKKQQEKRHTRDRITRPVCDTAVTHEGGKVEDEGERI